MAERRMFAKSIIDSDAFLSMPLTTQSLYFHLSMRADDDGFINNYKIIQKMIGCSEDDLKLLAAKGFIIPFDTGVVVIKHWRIHNYIAKDRYKPTNYDNEKEMLEVKDNGSYTLKCGTEIGTYTDRIQSVYDPYTQYSIDKNSIDKNNIYMGPPEEAPTQKKKRKSPFVKPTLEEIENYIKEKKLNVDASKWLAYYESCDWLVGKNKKMTDWKAAVRYWNTNNKTSIESHQSAKSFNNFEGRSPDYYDDLEKKLLGY